jgi:large subunit ribosomal protein L24
MKIKKGDTILVTAGKDKGKKAKVLKALPKAEKLLVEGVNIIKKHQKARRQGEKGEIIKRPAPIDSSNVKIVCPKCSKASRVGYIVSENSKKKEAKSRICKKCNQEI